MFSKCLSRTKIDDVNCFEAAPKYRRDLEAFVSGTLKRRES
jgi:hypothetical protein